MSKTILFMAISIDGYIADDSNGVNWLRGEDESVEDYDSYSPFIKDISAIVMGYNTYRQIFEELSPDIWPYKGLTTYVVTHHPTKSSDEIIFTNENPAALVLRLRNNVSKNIWICGGADVVNQLMKEDLIDIFHLSIIPTILGGGIRLWRTEYKTKHLKLIRLHSYNGVIETVYERIPKDEANISSIQYIVQKQRSKVMISKLLTLWVESVRVTHGFLSESDIEKLKPYVIEGLTYITHLYIAGTDDEPVAFIGIQDEKIEMLFVSPRQFRRGFGKQLVDIAIKNHQATFVDVNEQNPKAKAFYESLGFTEVGRTETDEQGNPFPIIKMRQKEFSLQTERLIVCSLNIHDVDRLHSFMGRENVMYAWEHGFTKAEVREWIDRQIYRYYSDGIGYWGVCLRENPEMLIGQAGLMKTTMNGKEAVEIGYIFHDTYWHNGYATEVVKRLVRYAFDNMELPAVYCSIRPGNKTSIRVAERIGMKLCGNHIVVYRGKEIPHLIYKLDNH